MGVTSCSGLNSVTIPIGVTSIGDYAFNSTGLTSVIQPEGLTSIGNSAFSSCTGLASVTIPDGVTSIGNAVFNSCTGLTSVTLPDGVTSIGSDAFYNCTALPSITIPAAVTSIGGRAFPYCEKLAEIRMESAQPPSLGSKSLSNLAANCVIFVPQGTAEAYDAEPWNGFTIEEYVPAVRLADGKPFANTVERPVAPLTYTRTFANTEWQALYVPFALEYADWADDFDVARIDAPELAPVASPSVVYTLDGRRVKAGTGLDGLPKGIYIVDGKKVMR